MAEFPPDFTSEYSDWEYVFAYARGPRTTLPDRRPTASYDRPTGGDQPSDGSFARVDVREVIAYADGDNDGPDWLMLGQLHDGRFFFLYAGCDYTGWGCQESGGSYVSDDLPGLVRWAMADEDRERLNVPLPALLHPSDDPSATAQSDEIARREWKDMHR